MKKSSSIWDMLKMQVKNVKCPACEALVSKIKLNEHLDTNCPSYVEDEQKICPKEYRESDFKEGSNKCKSVNTTVYSKKSNIKRQYSETDNSSCVGHGSELKQFNNTKNNVTVEHETQYEIATDVATRSSTNGENEDCHLKDEKDSNLKSIPKIPESVEIVQTAQGVNEKLSTNSKLFLLEVSETKSKNDIMTDADEDQPYYLTNFKHILNSVLMNCNNCRLFNDEDMEYVNVFQYLSGTSQKLYLRLFQRKYKWLRPNKIIYPEIAKDTSLILEELVLKKLLISGIEEIDLETALNMLSLLEVKNIGKYFRCNVTGKNKQEIISLLLKHGQQHKSVLINSSVKVSQTVLKRVRETIGQCYKLALEPKRVFTRILMLFSLPNIAEDEDEACGGQQQQLLTLLLINKGQLTFPEYSGKRNAIIFQDRDDLIRFEEARQLKNDIINAMEVKNFELGKKLYNASVEEYQMLCEGNFSKRDLSMPSFLRCFSACHVYIRSMSHGVEILQKLREYEEAVKLLKKLLSQQVYCQDYRGQWWDRMALNIEQHLKQPREALEVIKQALQDGYVRGGYRFSLLSRAQRIIRSISEDEMFAKEVSEAVAVKEAPRVIIKGRLFPRSLPGRKHVFISSTPNSIVDDEDDITVLGVEDLALEHYKKEGYTEGIHGESSTFISIYALLFWNIIYDGDIPDVFISPYQGHPLDLNSDNFFCSRKDRILNHLEYLRNATFEVTQNLIKSTWDSQFGKVSLVKWDSFTGVEQIEGLVHCLGNDVVAGICERLAKDFRYSRSGVPDLVVWNPSIRSVKVVEVKGPGDRLSSKQVLWLDYLLTIGVEAEVCLVEAIGSKKLKRN